MSNNIIEPTAYIGKNVKIGTGNYIGHYTVIDGDVTIGNNNFISHHVVIGQLAQNSVHKYELNGYPNGNERKIFIGSNNVIREFTTVHLPMEERTKISDNCYLMAYNHISHDTLLEDNVILANNIQIGGFTTIQKAANIGLSSIIHQFSTIGAYSMIGMGTVINRDIPPFMIAIGNPVRYSGKINSVGLKRNGFSQEEIDAIENFYSNNSGQEQLSSKVSDFLAEFFSVSKRKVVDCEISFDLLIGQK